MGVVVVTEGEIDREILGHALACHGNTRVVAASGRSAADSYARSLLMVRPYPVVLVVDADSNDDAAQRETRAYYEASLGQVAVRERYKVILAKPEIEAVLFDNDAVAERLFGPALGLEDRVAARYAPKQVANKLLHGESLTSALHRLGDNEWNMIGQSALIREIVDFADRASRNGSDGSAGVVTN